MPKNHFPQFIFLLLFIFENTAWETRAWSADVLDKIGSIDGATSVEVRKGKSARQAKSGDPVAPGETVITDSKTTATVRSPDGTVLVIGYGSALTIDSDPNALRTAKVEKGTVRAIVSKTNAENPGPSKKFRYFLKTATATMGVRGTDFVIDCDLSSSAMDLHTLEGAVEVAKDIPTMISQGGVKVEGGQRVIATRDGVGKPTSFDARLFAEQLSRTQPGLAVPLPPENPAWTKRSNYVKGDRVYFVGVAANVTNREEGRKKALEAANQELREYLHSADVTGVKLQTHMTYEEKTGSTFKVFILVSAPLKDLKKIQDEAH